jgi:hypothetical protein
MQRADAHALVNWTAKTVTVSALGATGEAGPVVRPLIVATSQTLPHPPLGKPQNLTVSIMKGSYNQAAKNQQAIQSLSLMAKPIVVAPSALQQSWVLPAQTMLDHDLNSWAARSGWHVDWLVKNTEGHTIHWIVPETTTFTGSFEQAITDTMNAVATQMPDAGIQVKGYMGNHLLRIFNVNPIQTKEH